LEKKKSYLTRQKETHRRKENAKKSLRNDY